MNKSCPHYWQTMFPPHFALVADHWCIFDAEHDGPHVCSCGAVALTDSGKR